VDAPRARSERTSRSSDTDGSPISILATRDWLDRRSLASSAWVRRRRRRRTRRLEARRSFTSIYAASSSVRPRNSRALPILQPLASSRFLLSSRTVVLLEPSPAGLDDRFWSRPALLAEHPQNHDGVRVNPIHHSSRDADILDSQFMATNTDGRHRPRMGHREPLAVLEPPEEVAGFHSGRLREGRRLDLTVKPDKGLVLPAHSYRLYVGSDIPSICRSCEEARKEVDHGRRLTGRPWRGRSILPVAASGQPSEASLFQQPPGITGRWGGSGMPGPNGSSPPAAPDAAHGPRPSPLRAWVAAAAGRTRPRRPGAPGDRPRPRSTARGR
jgi:hypothetical protein